MRSGNPALRATTFQNVSSYDSTNAMSIQGTVNKTFVLLGLVVFCASLTWNDPEKFMPFLFPAVIGGFIVALLTIFNKPWAPITSPVYAVLEGFFLGGISIVFERKYPGIVFQAVGLTFGTLFCLLMAYKSRWIKVTDNFRLGIVAATGAIFLLYIVNLVMSFFGSGISFIHESGTAGIIFSLVVVAIAALNLVLDFDFIERGARSGAPKYMEWYGAFGLLVTLVWLYLEILRLLSKTRRR
ncbi:MAG: Bax inhibitor-1/YccA family protein [bacterium]